MVIDFERENDLCVLRMRGRFQTGADAPYLRSRIDELKSQGCRRVIADFTEVPYLDSTGIGFVVGMFTSVQNAGGRFALASANKRVTEVLGIMKLTEVIPMYADEQAARAALADTCAAGGV